MKLRAVLSSAAFARRLRAADSMLHEAVVTAAAEALRGELEGAAGSTSSLFVTPHGVRRVVGSSDPADAAREFGTPEQAPSPWLAPVLPLALEPMRAAADAAAARAVSHLAKRKK